jgi:hypothetical protein
LADVLSQDAIDAMVAQTAPPPPAAAPEGADSLPSVVQVSGPDFAPSGVQTVSGGPAPAPAAPAPVTAKVDEALAELKERIGRMEADIGGVIAREKMMSGSSSDLAELKERTEQLAASFASLTGGIQTVSQHLDGTPGYGAKSTFVCAHCQTQGKVAVPATCTQCGTQTWLGWFPQQ